MKPCLIIPALNEEQRIVPVIVTARDSGLFSEVLVVDDGSTDRTAQAAEDCQVRVIRHERNQGKARAMQTGLTNTTAEIVTYLDADLLHITAEHIQSLLEPVVSGQSRAALAVFSGGRLATTLAQKITPMISGQRCLRRELLDDFDEWDTRFGIETSINNHLVQRGVEQLIIQWPGAAQVMKEEKRGCLAGWIARMSMYWDILKAWARSKRRR